MKQFASPTADDEWIVQTLSESELVSCLCSQDLSDAKCGRDMEGGCMLHCNRVHRIRDSELVAALRHDIMLSKRPSHRPPQIFCNC